MFVFIFQVAVNSARSWTGDYITDFRQLLPGKITSDDLMFVFL